MLNDSAVSHYVRIVHGHPHLIDFIRLFEYGGFIHVVPSAVQIVATEEVFAQIKRAPEVSRICVEIINPYGDSWPALCFKNCCGIWVADEYVFKVSGYLRAVLNLHTLCVHKIIFRCFDVRVVYHNKTPV